MTTPPLRLYQAVRLRVDVPDAGLHRGTPGRVLLLNPRDPQHVEVEFHVEDGSKFGRYVERIVSVCDLDTQGG